MTNQKRIDKLESTNSVPGFDLGDTLDLQKQKLSEVKSILKIISDYQKPRTSALVNRIKTTHSVISEPKIKKKYDNTVQFFYHQDELYKLIFIETNEPLEPWQMKEKKDNAWNDMGKLRRVELALKAIEETVLKSYNSFTEQIKFLEDDAD